jgi:hypothetical protein
VQQEYSRRVPAHVVDSFTANVIGACTRRSPSLAYYVDVTLIGAWCELRSGYRNFRIERIATSKVLAEHFSPDRGRLLTEWLALRIHRPDPQH